MLIRKRNYPKTIIEIFIYVILISLPFSKAVVEISFGICMVTWFFWKVSVHKWRVSRYFTASPTNKLLFIFFFTCALSLIGSFNFRLSLRALFSKVWEYIFLYIFTVEVVDSSKKVKRIATVLTFTAGLIVADSMYQYVVGHDFLKGYPFYSSLNRRLTASFSTSSAFGGWIILIAPILLGISHIFTDKKAKGLALFLFFALLLILVATQSRIAWMGIILSFVFFIFAWSRFLRRYVKLILGAVFIAGTLYLVFCPYNRNLKAIFKGNDPSVEMHIRLWKQAVDFIKERPITGWGLNTYTEVARKYKEFDKGSFYPHNSFLQLAIETGVAGLLAFVFLLIAWFRCILYGALRKGNLLLITVCMGVSAFLIQSLFDNNLYALSLAVFFWVVLGLGTAIARVEIRQSV